MELVPAIVTCLLVEMSLTLGTEATNESTYWELKLYNDLMPKINRNIRPMRDPRSQLLSSLNFALARIESLDEKAQVLTAFGWMQLFWNNEVIQWDPADYGGAYKMVVNGDQIWIPEVAMLNSVQQGSDLTLTTDFRVGVFSSGGCVWAPGFRWETTCRVNLRYFPFDIQICEVQFVNWVYNADEVNMTYVAPEVDLTFYESHGEWDLISTAVGRTDIVVENAGTVQATPVVAFQLTLKRKPGFLLLNIVAPAIIMTIISTLVFCLPVEAGEKVSLGITVLLSFSVVILMMSDITPRSSDNLPLLTLFTVIGMGLTALSLVATITVLAIHHQSPDTPLPRWVRSIFLNRLASLLCIRRTGDTADSVKNIKIFPTQHEKENTISTKTETGACLSEEYLALVRMLSAKEVEKDEEEKTRGDWAAVAHVVDRLFLVVYVLVVTVLTAVIMGMLMDNDQDGSTDDIINVVPDTTN